MNQDSIEYLNGIQERMIAYDDVRADVLDYVLTNEVKNSELITHLFIMGFLLEAHCRGEELSEQELNMFLGVDEELDYFYDVNKIYILDESQSDLELEELLDLTVENFSVD